MSTLVNLTKRNMKVFLRNKSSVFFSFLTMFIILGLNTVFLGKINDDRLSQLLPIKDQLITYITGSWLMAGLVGVNALTVTASVLGLMVEDEENHRMIAFMVAPIKRVTLTLSYAIAACLISFLFVVITIGISELYLWLKCEELILGVNLLMIIIYSIVNIISVVSMMLCIATRMKSTSSYGTFNTMLGTVIGFAAGIYLPIGSLPETLQNVLKFFPVLHGTAMVREVYTRDAINKGFAGMPLTVIEDYKKYMGITIYAGDEKINLGMSLLILLGSGLIFIILAAILLSKKQTSDR